MGEYVNPTVVGVADCAYPVIKKLLVDRSELAVELHVARLCVQKGKNPEEALKNMQEQGFIHTDYYNARDDDPVLVEAIRGCLGNIAAGTCTAYPQDKN